MVKMNMTYQGQLHCEMIHEQSNSKIETDAPKDNQGKGERFSPTDLVGAALGSCILTTMAIVGERDGLDLKGISASVEKEMTDKPRHIGALKVKVTMPAFLAPNHRRKLEEAAHHCPVHRSLHPDVNAPIEFVYV